ncbi:DUF1642 domain-containing protein [Streptococcus dysgalactiae]|uniref:DUF1642 domain-containing protein n=1 Tax=Streptococcus dysgalactiae TaxID=1334 RepID=UPI001E61FD42|nr:DUF1642 domain-containing protein [Streptococcus dysgalactiae]WCE86479.1 DUF1642 domain-containing protein [Streptococcus dysgalactiae]WCN26474.1 DUF1642 domain-containing protein [Streptococcus dysgalactiae]
MKIEDLKRGTQIWVRGYADGMGNIDFLDSKRNVDELDWLIKDDIYYMSDSDFRLDEPDIDQPKPVVPQFVADWLRYCKENKLTLLGAFEPVSEHGIGLAESFENSVRKCTSWAKDNQDIFSSAWLAYPNVTVEKEKLYTVKILGSTLFKMTSDNGTEYKLIGKNETPSESKFNGYKFEVDLTEKEIKEADERLWQFAKEVTE